MFRIILLLAIAVFGLVTTAMGAGNGLPGGFSPHPFNGPNTLDTKDGVTTFTLKDGGCSKIDYGDGRGESDCNNGNVRMGLTGPIKAVGQTVDYKVDLWIDPNMQYPGYINSQAMGWLPDGRDSMLNLGNWEGEFLHNFFFTIQADKTRGIMFATAQCQAPSDFGKWVSFDMKVHWANDKTGWIKVSCNDKIIYDKEDLATNQSPLCYTRNQCEPNLYKDPKKVIYFLGPVMKGNGAQWKETGWDNKFVPIPPEGITVKMRNMSVANGAVLYGPEDMATVKALQAALNNLGCSAGPADGKATPATKAAVLSCRKISSGESLGPLTVATAKAWLALYTQNGVADLPAGPQPPAPPMASHVGVMHDNSPGDAQQVDVSLAGLIPGGPKGASAFEVLIQGVYVASIGGIVNLEITPEHPLDKKTQQALFKCQNLELVPLHDGKETHLGLKYSFNNNVYELIDRDCILKALDPKYASVVTFLFDHFADIARAMVKENTVSTIKNNGFRQVMTDVANGKVMFTAH